MIVNFKLFLKKIINSQSWNSNKDDQFNNDISLLNGYRLDDDISYWSKFGEEHKEFAKEVLDKVSSKENFESEILHLKQLMDDEYRKSYNYGVVRIISHVINCMKENQNSDINGISSAEKIKVADFACWSGATSRYISNNLKVYVTGIEVNKDFNQFANRFLSNEITQFALVENQTIQLEDESQDIILASGGFASVLPKEHEIMLSELSRILKPNGIFLLLDSNNPRNEQVKKRLKELYRNLENSEGSFFKVRKNFISKNYPNKNAEKIAHETCYYDKKEIISFLNGNLPKSKFKSNSLKVPIPIGGPDSAPSNPTDPFIYKKLLASYLRRVKYGSDYLMPEEPIETSNFVLWGQK